MKKMIQNLILIWIMAAPGLMYGGQHSGLGGGTPPAPTPAPDPTLFETLEQYYQQYYSWLREQMEANLDQPNFNSMKKN